MKKYCYIAAVALGGSSLAQDQNQNANQSPSGQPRPTQTQPGVNQAQQPTTPDTATTTGDRVTQAISNLITDWRLEDLPPAVQKTVREQSGGKKIDDIDREDRSGSTVWEVEFEEAGKDTEIHIAQDGSLIPEGNRAFGRVTDQTGTSARPGERASATGAAAGAQVGRSGAAVKMGTNWEDLPAAVQQKAMQFGGKDKVEDIDREEWQGKAGYEVEFSRQGRNLEIHFSEDGAILESNDPSVAPAQGAQGSQGVQGSRGAQGAAPGADVGRSPATSQPAQSQPSRPSQPRLETLPQPQGQSTEKPNSRTQTQPQTR